MMTLGDGSNSRGTLVKLAFGAYVLGAPLVHLEHRRPGRAVGRLSWGPTVARATAT